MRAQKDRLYRALVIGATPAGIAATNKLGEMGIPVTLVDSDPDLNEKLAREEWRLSSGVTFNYALRPGLLRILRNPRIRCILPGEVLSLKHTLQGFSARLRGVPTFVDRETCTLCGKCAEICPVSNSDGVKPIHFNGRQSLPGRPVIDKRREPLCQANCPLGVNAQGYVVLAKSGRFAEALDLVRRDNVLPGICGRVCMHPCESACRRGELDEPLAIRDIKRFLADYEMTHPRERNNTPVARRPQSIAVIGSGPAGLAAAADLARQGYAVTVFEKEKMIGGLLRYGIGPHRLPREILDHEIEYIKGLGVVFETEHPIDLPGGLGDLRKKFDGVIVATGTWTDRKLGAPGEDLNGVEGCVEFLGRFYRGAIKEFKEDVAVIGDGNAALDVARVLVRLGSKVTIVSWFPEDMIPADPEEVQGAREEGISIVDRAQVIGFLGQNGKLEGLRCACTKPGEPDANGIPWPVIIEGEEPFDLQFSHAIVAIGQARDMAWFGMDQDNSSSSGVVTLHDGSTVTGVYTAGDAVLGPASVVRAMASGREAAQAVHSSLNNGRLNAANLPVRPADKEFAEIPADIPSLARAKMPERQAAARKGGFAEVALGLNEVQVVSEAARCLQCGVCSECLQCAEVCGAPAAIHHDEQPDESTEQVGVVIIADPAVAPSVKGEDVIRAYSTKGASDDVHAMMLRGFAAAAEAMLLLGGGAERIKGHGLSFTPPDPGLSPDIRLGVFVCRCNDAFGWSDGLDAYVNGLMDRPNVQHAEVTASACTPEGSASILRAVREKGLTRLVLASCVCCPLDFVCSACTDQRSRLKDALFKGTGISRAMVETCNVRGEALRFLRNDPSLAADRFTGLIERSIGRARNLKTMPAPARPYNFTTAVIGDSESALKSALMLAEAGMEVFLFGAQDKPLSTTLEHPNIHSFDGSSVKGVRGTVGNFQVVVEINGSQQSLNVGAIILGEQSRKRIMYMPASDLPARMVEWSLQKRGVTGIPFFSPGATSVPGLFLANPPGINVSERIKGAAAAILATSVMPRRPRQNKGYTVVVDKERCRGCGRCIQVCPYQAVSFRGNNVGGWHAVVDEALCKGCGNCISVCPSDAADSPYRDRRYLEQMIDEILL
jgi:NADPH-dependent glutamate synthase beta subunit-like oxidoreductase/NAD-dependent dihydropyrimidine dehydrogenase PreA subunit